MHRKISQLFQPQQHALQFVNGFGMIVQFDPEILISEIIKRRALAGISPIF